MIRRFTIRGFKRFERETAIDLDPVTVLVGANNSGKSTILEALTLFQYCVETTRRANGNGRGNERNGRIELGRRSVSPDEFGVLPVAEPTDLWPNGRTGSGKEQQSIELRAEYDNGAEIAFTLKLSYNRFSISPRSSGDVAGSAPDLPVHVSGPAEARAGLGAAGERPAPQYRRAGQPDVATRIQNADRSLALSTAMEQADAFCAMRGRSRRAGATRRRCSGGCVPGCRSRGFPCGSWMPRSSTPWPPYPPTCRRSSADCSGSPIRAPHAPGPLRQAAHHAPNLRCFWDCAPSRSQQTALSVGSFGLTQTIRFSSHTDFAAHRNILRACLSPEATK